MRMLTLQTIKGSAGFILLAFIIGFTVNLFHPKGYVAVSRESLKYKKIVFIDSTEAKIKFDAGNALFADSRSQQEYSSARIRGSINIPALPDLLSLRIIKENFNKINSKVELVIYCAGETCGSSEILARRIIGLGYSRSVYIIKEGLPAWEKNGYPVDRGDAE